MKNKLTTAAAVLLIAVLSFAMGSGLLRRVWAQAQSGATPVQQTATMLNAATKVSGSNGAVNTQVTATATPSGSNYVYIVALDFAICQNGTSTAVTNVTFTSTNITGNPVWQFSVPATAQACNFRSVAPATPLKSTTPGTAVTIVSPAALTNAAYNANIYWYEAP